MLTIDSAYTNHILVVTLSGRVDTLSSGDFEQEMNKYADDKFIILDFSDCHYMASSGLRVLIKTAKRTKVLKGRLFLSNVMPEVYQVLEMSGLHMIFDFKPTTAEALSAIVATFQSSNQTITCDKMNVKYTLINLKQKDVPALLWDNDGIVGLNELPFSVGRGRFSELPEEEACFFTIHKGIGFMPSNNVDFSDYRVVQDPCKLGVELTRGISLPEQATKLFLPQEQCDLTLEQLINLVLPSIENQSTLLGMLIADRGEQPALTLCIVDTTPTAKGRITTFSFNGANGCDISAFKFQLEELGTINEQTVLSELLEQSLQFFNIIEAKPASPTHLYHQASIWVFETTQQELAAPQRIAIEAPAQGFDEAYKPFLTRRLYNDCSRVVIKQLHGGFSAQTFYVESYDKQGRKLRPTVMKMADKAMIKRETEHCQKNALPYIFNNSAMVLGSEFYEGYGALCYNFVGIGGEETELKWLTHHYDDHEVDYLEPLFDRIFMHILKPWYGQPVKRDIFPFVEHDPTKTFFSQLCETASDVLGVDSDKKMFFSDELNKELINPYWFLKHRYKVFEDWSISYNTSICHGDLNMQNILLDQDQNIYLIDFSETKPRSIVSDFARLEAIFIIEYAKLGPDSEAYYSLTNELYDFSELTGSTKLESVFKSDKNVVLSQKMRSYAATCTVGDDSVVPYYLALLEWMLPIVCFNSDVEHKRLSMIVSGLICTKLEEELG